MGNQFGMCLAGAPDKKTHRPCPEPGETGCRTCHGGYRFNSVNNPFHLEHVCHVLHGPGRFFVFFSLAPLWEVSHSVFQRIR